MGNTRKMKFHYAKCFFMLMNVNRIDVVHYLGIHTGDISKVGDSTFSFIVDVFLPILITLLLFGAE